MKKNEEKKKRISVRKISDGEIELKEIKYRLNQNGNFLALNREKMSYYQIRKLDQTFFLHIIICGKKQEQRRPKTKAQMSVNK